MTARTLAWLVLFAGTAGCGHTRAGTAVTPDPEPSFMRLIIFRGDAEPQSAHGARFVVTMTDATSTRKLTSEGPDAPWREYPVSSVGALRVQVTVRGDSPRVRGDANAVIPLQPDLFLSVYVYAWSPSMNPQLYGCRCPHRLAFPLQAPPSVGDSLIVAWSPQSRSHPNPIR
jgi:hypothetical protein